MDTWCPAPIPGTWVPSVHSVCGHNVLASLLKRQLGTTPAPADEKMACLNAAFGRFKRLARLYRQVGGRRWTLERTAASYSGSLGRRYSEALRSIHEDGPVNRRDMKLDAFLKAEKFDGEVKLMKPRLIFPRSPRYNLWLASWLKPFEHWLWPRLTGVAQRGVPPSRVSAKGLNPTARAELIQRKMSHFSSCIVFEVDGAAFEAHLLKRHLQLEQSVYSTAYEGDPLLASALSCQLQLKGRVGPIRFSRSGGRASGDFNTGMGNTLIVLSCVHAIMRASCAKRWDTLADGDNALVFVERSFASQARKAFALSPQLTGQEFVLERPVDVLEAVRFGQSAPVFCGDTYRMVRDPWKVISYASSSHKHLREASFASPYIAAVAMCEGSLARGVPVLSAYLEGLYRAAGGAPRARALKRALEEYRWLVDPRAVGSTLAMPPVSMEARLSFSRAFGVSVDEQVRLEDLFASALVAPDGVDQLPGLQPTIAPWHPASTFVRGVYGVPSIQLTADEAQT